MKQEKILVESTYSNIWNEVTHRVLHILITIPITGSISKWELKNFQFFAEDINNAMTY